MSIRPDPDRVERARNLIVPQNGEEHLHVLSTWFDRFVATVLIHRAQERVSDAAASSLPACSLEVLGEACSHAAERFLDLSVRMELIRLLRKGAEHEGAQGPTWYLVGGLCIKDFHADVASFMDAISAVVIQATGGIAEKDLKRPPGWAAISGKRASGAYRRRLPRPIRDLIDATETRWWTDIRDIRDATMHRQHYKVAFGDPKEGLLFQIYDGTGARIVDEVFLAPDGTNIVDFGKYSAFVTAEVLLLLDDLGQPLAEGQGWRLEELTQSYSLGDFSGLIAELGRLHAAASA